MIKFTRYFLAILSIVLTSVSVIPSYAQGDLARNYGPVQSNENLWDIGKQFRPPYTTMSQVVMAIFQRNPQAFHKGDINRLKKGVMLEIPSPSAMQGINHRNAYAEIKRQIVVYGEQLDIQKEGQSNSLKLSESERVVTESAVETVSVEAELEEIEIMKNELEQDEVQSVPVEPAPVPEPKGHKERPLFRYSYDLSVAKDDNIRQAQNKVDIREDSIVSVTLNARGGMPLDNYTLLLYGGSVSYEGFDTFDKLNNFNFNAHVKYRFANSATFSAPVYTLGAKIGGIDSESEIRGSTLFSTSFDINKWLTSTINMTTGIDLRIRESKSEVFDTSEGRVFFNFDLNFSKSVLFYGTYTYITGDIVSSASPTLQIINAAEVIEPDDAFGGLTTNQFAYRLDADTQVFTLGYNHILSRSTSVDLSFRYIDSQAVDDIYYERNILRASLLGRF